MTIDQLRDEIMRKVGYVDDVVFDNKGEGQFVAHVQCSFYSLIWDPTRAKVYEKAREIIEANKEPGTTILVAVR